MCDKAPGGLGGSNRDTHAIGAKALYLPDGGDPDFEHRVPVARFYGVNHDAKETTVGFLVLLVVGGLIGWVASMIMRTDGQQGILLNVVVGIVGALLAGFIITPLIGGAPITSGVISIQSVVVSLVGAIVLLALINLFRRGAVR